MLLVAPDPRLGIAPDRVARVRVLLDAAPSAPGVAVAIPGGADGALDALVLRPDGVLGLVPGPVGARRPVGAAGSGARGGGLGTLEDETPAAGLDVDEASREIDRLLALGDPAPQGPRRVVALPPAAATGPGELPPSEARSAIAAVSGPPVVGVVDVRRLFVALRLADHVPGADALADAGFSAHPAPAPPTAPVATPGARREALGEPSRSTGAPGSLPPTGALWAADAADRSGDRHGAAGPGPDPFRPDPFRPDPQRPDARRREAHRPDRPRPGARRPDRTRSERHRPARPGRVSRAVAALPAWLWTWRGLAVAATVVFLLAVGAAVVVVRTITSPVVAAPSVPDSPRRAGAVTWTRQAQTVDTTCADHAYGLAAPFLRERSCARLERSLWSGTGPAGPMVLAVSQVTMNDPQSAEALKSLVDASGTGNVSDLLREGRTFPGAPTGLTDAGYASAIDGARVTIVESDWLDTSRKDEPTLDAVARDAVAASVGLSTN